jgi:hypothetical protein
MIASVTAASIFSRLAGPALKLLEWWKARHKPLLAPTLEPFSDPEMLRAFRVKLVNVSDTKIRLDDFFIRVPENSEFAISWHVPMMILGGEPSPRIPWERSRRYSINEALDPGDHYDCELGIPAGFAISESRRPPVTLAVSLTTLGAKERKLVQDIQRHITF